MTVALREPLLTVADVAELLRVSEASIYRWIASGELRARRLGRGRSLRIRVAVEEVDRFLADSASSEDDAGRPPRSAGPRPRLGQSSWGPAAGGAEVS
jgi:excisionase family DNA binding protein